MKTFGDSDGNMLNSGILADCKVVCDGKSWKLHKFILCSRSDYFKKCLLGDWSEAKSSKVSIEDFSSEQMDLVINYIYTGTIDFTYLYDKGELLHTVMQLWTLGEYFAVEKLLDDVREFFKDPFNIYLCTSLRDELTPDVNPKDWLAAGRFVYNKLPKSDRHHPIRRGFLEIIFDKLSPCKKILGLPEFQVLLEECPAFSTDCMTKIAENPWIMGRCHQCNVTN